MAALGLHYLLFFFIYLHGVFTEGQLMPHQCDTEQGNELPQNLKVEAQVMVLPILGVLFRIIFTYKKHIFYQLLKYTLDLLNLLSRKQRK